MGAIIDKTQGKIKQAVGALTGNEKLKQEGEDDELKGELEGAVDKAKDAVKDMKHAFKKAAK